MKLTWFFPILLCYVRAAMAARDLILGGRNATPGEFPFFAPGLSGCGGTLIHEDIVLTAAHCIVGGNTFREGVQVGGSIRPGALAEDPTLRDEMEERIGFACALIHPGYNHSVIGVDDIALVKLALPSQKKTIQVNFDPLIPTVGDNVTAIGYGTFGYHRVPGALSEPLYPTYLQVLSPMTIQSEDACRDGERNFGHYNPDYLLCIDDEDPVTTDCRADSGGPIFLTTNGDNAAKWLQVGLLVYGPNVPVTGECRGDRPSYYTNTAKYESFIRDGICRKSWLFLYSLSESDWWCILIAVYFVLVVDRTIGESTDGSSRGVPIQRTAVGFYRNGATLGDTADGRRKE
jgi:secreted trypsin-like serine protease